MDGDLREARVAVERAKRQGHHGNRHRRSEEARQAILEAADDLLAEIGFARLTVEGIAARAGVGKQTIYRWWASKTDILIDAFVEDEIEELTSVDSGDLRSDLEEHLNRLSIFLTRSDSGFVLRALVGEAQHDLKIAQRLRADFIGRQSDIYRTTLQHAQERGALAANVDIRQAIDQLVGPLYFRVLVTGEAITREFTDKLVADFIATTDGGHRQTPHSS